MKRREFLEKAALSALIINTSSYDHLFASQASSIDQLTPSELPAFAKAPAAIGNHFFQLLRQMNSTGWISYLNKTLSIRINAADTGYDQLLQKRNFPKAKGFEDFNGTRLIEPGFPAASLLYHALASARVQPAGFHDHQYPSPEQIDLLENFIYALKPFSADDLSDTVIAVLAYEYRPAYKTPHHQHADLVFSRTGIGRVGEFPLHYDVVNRCYTNKPADARHPKNIAVTPARFGVFLARIVKGEDQISLLGKAKDNQDDKRLFLRPVRKIFHGDELISTDNFGFSEYHINEKLQSLVTKYDDHFSNPADSSGKRLFDITKYPFRIESRSSGDLVQTIAIGSSGLISSNPAPLIRKATQNGRPVCFEVKIGDDTYFSALQTDPPIEDIEVLYYDSSGSYQRKKNEYKRPRNAPLFVNIKFKYEANQPDNLDHFEGRRADLGRKIKDHYTANLFFDNLCDGYVIVQTKTWTSKLVPAAVLANCIPAFSIITAPDFFPLADNFDLAGFDLDNVENESNFYEGGLYSLTAERTVPNQRLINFDTGQPAFSPHTNEEGNHSLQESISALYSGPPRPGQAVGFFTNPVYRTYRSTSYLPDVCSAVFAPGWDITYANDADGQNYLSTRGLGSPFPEDMKLCAAMNGMWPTTSPDASRTFQGSLNPDDRNPTAVPLMDVEIGLHPDSPHCKENQMAESTGWDGEQGPFLQSGGPGFVVNFTDLARADYVKNVIDNQLDMSLLRELTGVELRCRMACLKLAISKLPATSFDQRINVPGTGPAATKMVGTTGLWLVSAEKIDDWEKGAKGSGIPRSLVGRNPDWVTTIPRPAHHPDRENKWRAPGYLFVFVNTGMHTGTSWVDYELSKRKTQACEHIYVCQVTDTQLRWTEIPGTGVADAVDLTWNF